MDISELKQQLLDKKTSHYYIFIGNELALQDIYIEKIAEVAQLPILRADCVFDIQDRLTARPLFKVQNNVIVIRNDEHFYKTEKKWDELYNLKNFKGNILILLYSGVEKSSKFCKHHEKILTQFDYMGTSILSSRLQAITHMPKAYCDDIVNLCGNNYGRIKSEMYKMQSLAQINGYSWNTAYLEAKKMDLIHEDIGDIIFEFTNAIEMRNIKKAYDLWPKMQYIGEAPLKIITILYNSFRQILMVQSTPQDMRKEDVLGMTTQQIYHTSQKCNKYNIYEVVNIVKTLRYLEKGIKTGTTSEEYAMDYLMGVIW
jgi:DNA polymerase III delta subunit